MTSDNDGEVVKLCGSLVWIEGHPYVLRWDQIRGNPTPLRAATLADFFRTRRMRDAATIRENHAKARRRGTERVRFPNEA